MTAIVETERLVLRRFAAADLPAFVAYRRDPGTARYQSWEPTYSLADAERFLDDQCAATLGEPPHWVQLAIVDRGSAALCGDCAVRVAGDQPASAEIGITLSPAARRRGLATEALRGLVTVLFARHAMHRVFAHADERNESVHRLLERVGVRCEGRLLEADWFKGEWSTLRLYAVLAREWPPAEVDADRRVAPG